MIPNAAHPAIALLAALCLAACASPVPQAIRTAPRPVLSVAQVQQDPNNFLGQRVRWGGTIIAVVNGKRTTDIELLARPLDDDGEPRASAAAEGRFIARIRGFADPAEYPNDRRLTVVGKVEGVETRDVGDYPYRYPVMAAETLYVWPKPEPPPYPYPYLYPYPWYGPWYSPWYRPWGPWWGPWY
jgi:outer membrane lipoprotein